MGRYIKKDMWPLIAAIISLILFVVSLVFIFRNPVFTLLISATGIILGMLASISKSTRVIAIVGIVLNILVPLFFFALLWMVSGL